MRVGQIDSSQLEFGSCLHTQDKNTEMGDLCGFNAHAM
jgi:hypothetical protein